MGFSSRWPLLLRSRVPWVSAVAAWALDHRLSSLGCTSLVALWRVGSSWTRDQTHISCIGRQISLLAPREAHMPVLYIPGTSGICITWFLQLRDAYYFFTGALQFMIVEGFFFFFPFPLL